jgi:pantoate--beta-alanine ligase
MATTVWLGLGSNLGDRDAVIRFAVDRLGQVPGLRVESLSSIRETAPVGGPPQPDFRNAVARVSTSLDPLALLCICKAIEAEAGRRSGGERFGPRELDIDILVFGDQQIDTAKLIVPHPRLHEREFVLTPLRELGFDPDRLPRERAPKILATADAIAEQCVRWRRGGCRIGFVPTMGALHEGHASLLRVARRECDRVVASIYVNPLQFGPREDLARYPRPFEHDVEICRAEGVDAVFAPSPQEMLPEGFTSHVEVGSEAAAMEGAMRPTHFRGVATVVARLWSLVLPDLACFGAKDAQQVAVLRRLHRDLGLCGELRECPIVRDRDGLALSSRNVYLTPEDRAAATVLVAALRAANDAWRDGARDRDALLAAAGTVLAQQPRGNVEYLELRAARDLRELPRGPAAAARMLIAVRFAASGTRLLDNHVLGESLPT